MKEEKLMTETLLANRYKIIDKIGEGGMGIVWRVYDTVEQREVALKQFYKKEDTEISATQKEKVTPETIEATQTDRVDISTMTTGTTEEALHFKQEFRTMVKLKHPNTVNVFDYGVLENGDDYITMEIVPGKELQDILKERQLDFEEIYRILIQTCQVLNFIHSRLMVHRDIKPSNIRITPEGNVKLMDFGLMEQMGLPSTGEITGTVIYLPPEVAKGGIIDARSDLYSLGVMAYELVTGHPPFVGKNILDIIRQHIETPPIPPSQIRKGIPPVLEKIVLQLLAKDQNDRYQTTAELINDLVQLTGEKVAIETFEQRKCYLNCSELIGREREMQKLKDAFTLTTQGKGQSIFIAAPAGVGKTRLIQEFKLKVQLAKVTFVEGQCFEQGMTVYRPLDDAFNPLLPLVKKDVLDKYGSVLVKVIPELKRKSYQPAPKLDEVGEKVHLFKQVTGWLKEVSKVTPIVICIEDLHWSDFATLELLNACIRELQDYPIMILGAFRDDEVEPTSIIFQTVEEEITQLMKLSTLSQDDVQSLIKGMLGRIELTEDFTDRVYTVTAGNAFFVSETMRALIEEEQLQLERGRWILPIDISTLELPASIESTIIQRLKLLNPETLNLARTASIVGRNLDLSFLKELSGLEDERLFEILDELIERQFMKTEEKLYIFNHDRVRETLYNQLQEEKRKELHERAGTILEEQYYSGKGNVAIGQLGYHFSKGLNQQKAAKYLLMAGYQAHDKLTGDIEAAEYFIKAVELIEKIDYPDKEEILIDIRSKIGRIYMYGKPEVAIESLEKAISSLHNLGDISKALKRIKMLFKIINHLPKCISQNIKNRLNQPSSKTSKLKGDYLRIIAKIIEDQSLLSFGYCLVGEYDKSLSLSEKTLEYIPDPKSVIKAVVKVGQTAALGQIGDAISYIEASSEACDLFEKNERNFKYYSPQIERELWWGYGRACMLINLQIVFSGKKPDEKYLKKGFSIAEEKNIPDLELRMHLIRLARLAMCGVQKGFNELLNKMYDILKQYGRPLWTELPINIWKDFFYLQRGEFDMSIELSRKLISIAMKYKEVFYNIFAQIILSLSYFGKGKHQEAIRQLETTVELCRKYRSEKLVTTLYSLGEVYLKIGKVEKAIPLIQEAHQICTSERCFNEYYQIHTFRLLGQVAIERKKFEKAKEYLEPSLAIARECENPIQEGQTLFQLGRLHMKLTQHKFAKEIIQKAMDKFSEINNAYQIRKGQKLLNDIEEGKERVWKRN